MKRYKDPLLHQSIVQMPVKTTSPGPMRSGNERAPARTPEAARDRVIDDRDIHLTLAMQKTIREHRGAANAIKLKVLAEIHGINWRKAAAIVAELQDTGDPICTSRTRPFGVYWVDNPDEARVMLSRVDNLLRELGRKRHKLAKAFEIEFAIPYQKPLFSEPQR